MSITNNAFPSIPERALQGSTRVAGRSRLAVVGVTAAAALAFWAVLSQLAGIDLQAKQGSTVHVGAVSVLFASVVMAFAGWGLLAILEHNTVNARKAWTVSRSSPASPRWEARSSRGSASTPSSASPPCTSS